MDCCLQGSSSTLIAIVDVHSLLDQVLCCLDGPDSAFFLSEQFLDRISIVGHILRLDEEVDSGEVPHMQVNWVRLDEIDEEVDFGIVQQSKSLLIVLGRVVVGIHVVFVGLDKAGPLSFHEIHIYKEGVSHLFLNLFLTGKLIITDRHQEAIHTASTISLYNHA